MWTLLRGRLLLILDDCADMAGNRAVEFSYPIVCARLVEWYYDAAVRQLRVVRAAVGGDSSGRSGGGRKWAAPKAWHRYDAKYGYMCLAVYVGQRAGNNKEHPLVSFCDLLKVVNQFLVEKNSTSNLLEVVDQLVGE